MNNLLTIITPSFNSLKNLKILHKHLANFTNLTFTWLIIDSKSTDGTVEYFSDITDLWIDFYSIKDNGIYEGLNNGISLTNSKYYVVSGSDDLPNVDILLETIINQMNNEPDLILGNTIYEDGILKSPYIDFKSKNKSRMSFHSIGTIFKANLHSKVGKYSTTLSLASDELLFQKLFDLVDLRYYISEKTFGYYSNTGISAKNRYLATLEMFYVKYRIQKPNIFILTKTFIKLLCYKTIK